MTYRILCAYDQSAGSNKAFAFAMQLAALRSGELHVIGVFEPAEQSRGIRAEVLTEVAQRHFATSFQQLQARAAAVNAAVTCAVAVGSPAAEILKRAAELRADHVVVGQRGKNSHERTTVGSVSLRVVTQSAATVTVVR